MVGEADLMEKLCPFQVLYTDGVERLGAESALGQRDLVCAHLEKT